MVLKKQTIWLLTMLTLMVVLSAYYMMNQDPSSQYATGMDENNVNDDEWEETWLETLNLLDDEDTDTAAGVDGDESDIDVQVTNADELGDSTNLGLDSTEVFLSYKQEREVNRSRMIDDQKEIIVSDASPQVVAEAKRKKDELHEMNETESRLESLIQADYGYDDAVVFLDDDKVNVIVKADDTLQSDQALDIIHLVRQHLEVPGQNIFVSYY